MSGKIEPSPFFTLGGRVKVPNLNPINVYLKISPRIKVPEIFYVSKSHVLKKDYGFSNLEEILHVTRGPAHENASILAYDF